MSGHYKEKCAWLLERGYAPVPIAQGKKHPAVKGWQDVARVRAEAGVWAANGLGRCGVGLVCGEVIGIDIDVDDVEQAALWREALAFELGDGLWRESKPGRGLLLYRVEGDSFSKLRWGLGDDRAIEVLATGQQFVAYGRHPSGVEYTWPEGGPADVAQSALCGVTEAAVVAAIEAASSAVGVEGRWATGKSSTPDTVVDAEGGGAWLVDVVPPTEAVGREERVVRQALAHLDHWVEQLAVSGRWITGGYWRISSAALGRDLEEDLQIGPDGVYDFGEERGRDLLDTVAEIQSVPRSEALAWLADQVDAPAAPAVDRLAVYREAFEAAKDRAAWDTAAEHVRRSSLPALDRDLLAGVAQQALARIEQGRATLKTVRQALLPAVREGERVETEQIPDWASTYVWVRHEDCFFDLLTGERLSVMSFDVSHARSHRPDMDVRPHQHVLYECAFPTVAKVLYAPGLPDRFTFAGESCQNAYVESAPRSVPEAQWSEQERGAVQRMQAHLRLLCGEREDVYKALLDWLAYNVQVVGGKLRYSPIIKGIEGDGKSLLGKLMSAVMGGHVEPVGSATLKSAFNSWAQGSRLVVLEEIAIAGRDRLEVFDRIKPLITNDEVQIHRKNLSPYRAPNFTNYLAFTNRGDALPLSQDDRRWLVIATPWSSMAEMSEAVGDVAAYFAQIHDDIEKAVGALRGWLLSHPLSADFSPHHCPLRTEEAHSMSAANQSDGAEVLQSIIEQGVEGVSTEILATAFLRRAAADFLLEGHEPPSGRALGVLLTQMHWQKSPRMVRWNGMRTYVWVRGQRLRRLISDAEALKAELDKTARVS